MTVRPKMVLLVGETTTGFLRLVNWLCNQGCRCHFATSYRDACSLISRTQFDLVLSQYQLPDRTAFPLLARLTGSPTTLFLSTHVESGCLWLPMLERGKRCIGAPVLRSDDLTEALSKALDRDTRSDESGTPGVGARGDSPSARIPDETAAVE
jgi:CheY-like chemotaxis protein